jgi:hypothetical protein
VEIVSPRRAGKHVLLSHDNCRSVSLALLNRMVRGSISHSTGLVLASVTILPYIQKKYDGLAQGGGPESHRGEMSGKMGREPFCKRILVTL